ncbi:MAG: hypothetical protein AAFY25_09465, partial [Pseudomonadota bacterium]
MRATTRQIRKISAVAEQDATPHYLSLRGGRMTKVAGVVASFAPTLGTLGASVSVVALSAALMLGGQAQAQAAIDVTLSGAADPNGNDAEESFSAAMGDSDIDTAPGFGRDSSNTGGANAISLTFFSNVTLTDDNNSDVTGNASGIVGSIEDGGSLTISWSGSVRGEGADGVYVEAQQSGPGASNVDVTVQNESGTATATGNNSGIDIYQQTTGTTSVSVDSAYGASEYGVRVYTTNSQAGEVTVNAYGNVRGDSDGIRVNHRGNSAVTITSQNEMGDADVYADGGYGIAAYSDQGAGITISSNDVYGYYGGIHARNNNNNLWIDDNFIGLSTPSEAAPNSISITATGN